MVNSFLFGALSNMENWKQHFWQILLFYYGKGKIARQKLFNVYGDVLTECQCQYWFAKFCYSNFHIEYAACFGRPVEVDEHKIKPLTNANCRITNLWDGCEIKFVKFDHSWEFLGFTSKFNIWIPHVHTKRNLLCCIDICDLLFKHQENDPYLKWFITGDEKMVVYSNDKRKKS